MQSFYDRQSLDHALSLPLDAQLRRLLRERLDHLATLDPSVGDTTYFLVVDAATTGDELMGELGWSPLIDLDGHRFGSDAYRAFHDFIVDRGGWFEVIYSISNEAVVVMIVENSPYSANDIAKLCVHSLCGLC